MPEEVVAVPQQTPAAPPVAQPPADGAAPAPQGEQNQAEQAPAATEAPTEKQGRNRFERRIDAANRRYGEAKARADLLEKRLAEIEQKIQPKTPQAGRPQLSQFDDIEKYAEAVAEWTASERLKQHQARTQQETVKQQRERVRTEWEQKATQAEEKWEDFSEVVGDISPDTPLLAAIMDADPSVAYHLAKNPAEARKLAALPPLKQIAAIGKLEAKLESSPETAKAPSKAPAPINPVSAKSSQPSEEPSEEDDTATWIKKRNRQVHKKK